MKLLTMLACVLMIAACTQDKQAGDDSEAPRYPPRVYTVNYPLAYFAERIAAGQARVVFDSLVRLRPENESDYRECLHELEKDLGELDTRLKVVAERIGNQPLLFSHPVYQYLVRGYGLNGRSVHWEPDEIPGDDQWRELFELLGTHNAGWMIWEDEPLPEAASRLGSMGIESLVFSPCGNRPAEGSFVSVMMENVLVLERAFPAPASVVSF